MAINKIEMERSLEVITVKDLREIHAKSVKRLHEHFIHGEGRKWEDLHGYDIKRPLVVALCQGAAMHYHDKCHGVKDFDVWFFYPLRGKPLPYRFVWHQDYNNSKFGHRQKDQGYVGRRIDIIVRSIRNYVPDDPVGTVYQYLEREKTSSSRKLAQKAVVLLDPEALLGKTVWYQGRCP